MSINIPITTIILILIALAGIAKVLWYIAKFRNEWYGGTLKDIEIDSKRVNNSLSNLTPEIKDTSSRDVKIFTGICFLAITFSIWALIKVLENSNDVLPETVLYVSLIISLDFFLIVILILLFLFRTFSFYIHNQITEQTSLSNWLKQMQQVLRQPKKE